MKRNFEINFFENKNDRDALLKIDAHIEQNQVFFYLALLQFFRNGQNTKKYRRIDRKYRSIDRKIFVLDRKYSVDGSGRTICITKNQPLSDILEVGTG